MASPDVPRGSLLIDPPEKQRSGTLPQDRHPVRQSGLIVEIGLAGATEVVKQHFRACPHSRQRAVRMIEVVLLDTEFRVLAGDGLTHREPAQRRWPNHKNSGIQTRK